MNEEMKQAWLEISQMLGEPTREELDVFLRTWQRAMQAERNRTWTQEHWTEYERSIAAAEREACAKVCESQPMRQDVDVRDQCAAAIRARSNT